MDEKLLKKLTCFIQTYLPYTDKDLIKNYLNEHYKFHTIDYAIDKGEIIGIGRWNVSDDGEIGYILDLAIHPDYRGQGLGKHFILRALKKFPKMKYLSFNRQRKKRKEERIIPVEVFLKHNFF
jgi:ribosomal protein S18 acetylase RimI-like enzyme